MASDNTDFLSFQDLLDEELVPVPECLRENTRPSIENIALDVGRWTDRSFFNQEVSHLWPKVWQMACREAVVSEPGDYFVYEITRYSILLVCTDQKTIKAYHNSCLHRGRAIKSGKGRSRELRCPYHGFTWNLDGSFKEAFCQSEFSHTNLQDLRLPEIQVAKWGGWVFINMDPKAPSFSDYLSFLPNHFCRWEPEKRFVSLHIEKVIQCNWKAALEAFIESYHAIQTHPQILSFTGGDNSQYDVWGDHLSRTITPQGIPNPGQADRFSVIETVNDMLGPKGFEEATKLVDDMANQLSSRQAIAAVRRKQLESLIDDKVLQTATNSELMDSILYLLFPNFSPWGGFQTQITYRHRPNGMDVNSCLMDIYFLESCEQGTETPPDAAKIQLSADQSFSEVPGFEALASIFDQDANNLPEVQRGLHASNKGQVISASYQELRIRHFHATLDKYLSHSLSD
jgi:phenylpropionate dioxygenase-like ring-hydroxylating dioxygenase large terminal subunit